jgi:hypothetical protein
MKDRIIITTCPLDNDQEKIFATCLKYDKELIDAIDRHGMFLASKGIETFLRKGNIIVTENGYYFAFFESYLKNAE